ncbi:MAG: NADH-quinone oxidoreductase subunit J [Burkholderiaceae bacterium]
MDFKALLFYLFALVAVYAGLRVVTARNPIHAALHLVLAFFTTAAIWMLLKAEFLAIALVLVYVGAVMVLFLFVVMMVDINFDKLREGFWTNLPLAAGVGVVIVLEMAFVLLKTFIVPESAANALVIPPGSSNTRELGRLIYTDYVYAFEVAAVVLLVAIVAAVALTLRTRKDTKGQDPNKQIAVKAADRMRIVKMASEKRE